MSFADKFEPYHIFLVLMTIAGIVVGILIATVIENTAGWVIFGLGCILGLFTLASLFD